MLRVGTYNIEWFDKLFNVDNTNRQFNIAKSSERSLATKRDAIATVLQTINVDILGVVEAPNTTTTTGIQDCATKLMQFFAMLNMPQYQVCMGYISRGSQELALVYDATKVRVKHVPGGVSGSKSNPPFDDKFFFDTDDDNVEEVYTMYRPPLEAEVEIIATGETFRLMLVHAKSKGIFNATDRVHFDATSLGNRRKLFAECTWIRRRINAWQRDGHRIIVMGDINDGPGMDYYETTFGKSGVEILIGDIFDPHNILIHHGGRPKWGPYGWEPSSTNFKDPYTGRRVNAQIDHILASPNIPVMPNTYHIWNPTLQSEARAIGGQLKKASDHYPVTLDLNL